MGGSLDTATHHRPVRVGDVTGGLGWLSLLAETTPGMGELSRLRARIVDPDARLPEIPHRLVLQSYALEDMATPTRPTAGARPLGSTQHAVSRETLRAGIDVSLIQMADTPTAGAILVAWVEPGEPDLEFDGRTRRPGPDGRWARVRPLGRTTISLERAKTLPLAPWPPAVAA